MYRVSISKTILCCVLIIINGCILASSSEPLYESDHPYLNDYEHTWTIKEPGASQIRLHFKDIILGKDKGLFPYNFDKFIIFDKNYNELKVYGDYSGFERTDFWTDWYTGDTVIIKLSTDSSGEGYGFSIDKVENSTGMGIYSSSLLESNHPYANNLEYTYPIYANGSTKTRIHFEYLDLAKDEGYFPSGFDKLIILDKYGNELTRYGYYFGDKKENFWTSWYTGDTFIVKLVTDGSGTGDGFKIDKIDPRREDSYNNTPSNAGNENTEPSRVSEHNTEKSLMLRLLHLKQM